MASRFYDKDGRAHAEIIGKNGRPRAVWNKDAIQHDWKPSWTTMIKDVLAAPGLERWKLRNLLESSLTLPVIEGESLEDRADRIYQDADKHSKQARDKGSVRHDMFMNVLNGAPVLPEEEKFAEKFRGFIAANRANTVQVETPLIGSKSGGRPDWIARLSVFGNPEQLYVVDYKGQEIFDVNGEPIIKNDRPKRPFFSNEMWIQVAGYSLDYAERHAQYCGGCVIVYCRNTGELYPEFKSPDEMGKWRRAAEYVRGLWRQLNDWPEFARIRAILETHELVDSRPFDPTLCGATPVRSTIHRLNGYQKWTIHSLTLTRFEDGHGEFEQAFTGHKILIQWPATQSDGETLLRLLGVLV